MSGKQKLFPLSLHVGHSRPKGKPLSCPQMWTAGIVTSWWCHIAEGLSNKKVKVYFWHYDAQSDRKAFDRYVSLPIRQLVTYVQKPNFIILIHIKTSINQACSTICSLSILLVNTIFALILKLFKNCDLKLIFIRLKKQLSVFLENSAFGSGLSTLSYSPRYNSEPKQKSESLKVRIESKNKILKTKSLTH